MSQQNKLRICVPICETTVVGMRKAIKAAARVADMVELRLDCLLPDELKRVDEIKPLLDEVKLPVVVTCRPKGQGGAMEVDLATRKRSWFGWPESSQVWRDMELDLVERQSIEPSSAKAKRLICSHHDLSETPANIDQIYEQLAATPARILKLATRANDVVDCLPLFRLLDRARREQREMIPIAMGPAGLATRILGPSRGAFLTFATPDQGNETAKGQLTVSELRNLYHVDRLSPETQITGLIGLPLSHSVSPHVHNAALQSVGVNGVYIPFPVRDVGAFLKRMVHPRTREIEWNIRGLSVTAPYKSTVIDALDWIEPTASELGAINTIVVEGDELHGYNTDILAFIQTLVTHFGEVLNAKCAVIGAGGAARAVVWGLKQMATNVTVFGRNAEQAKTLARELEVDCLPFNDARFGEFDLVINATTLGTVGDQESQTPARAEQLAGTRLACDLVYNPEETLFLREAQQAGCKTLGGLPMLVLQAMEQFKLWAGTDAPEQVMLQAARAALLAPSR